MYGENHYYGHLEILLRYSGHDPDLRVPMRLQHGWQPGPGNGLRSLREPGTNLVWSRRNLAQCVKANIKDAVAIGAPFLYLPAEEITPTHEKSLLVIPFHGWEKQTVVGTYSRYGDDLLTLVDQGFGPVTICLYWFEYEQPEIRAVFESRGFATTTMGARDDNPDFLLRQRTLIAEHAYVCSNRISTAAFYALHLDRPFFIWGPPQGLSETDDPTGEIFDQWQRETFPRLTYEGFDGLCHRDIADAELGAEFKRRPETLSKILMLGPEHRRARSWQVARRKAHRVLQLLHLR